MGLGWMVEFVDIVNVINDVERDVLFFFLLLKVLLGKNIMIIVGLIREFLDFVWYILNYSLGKMGFVIV